MKAPEANFNYTVSKKVQVRQEYFVQFTDEEAENLNIKEGDKFSVKITDEGILLERYGSLEINLSDYSRETLEFLIEESIEKDIPISMVFENCLRKMVDRPTMSPEQLGSLAQNLSGNKNSSEAADISSKITNGFYGS